jgi:hypothetical protein
MSKLKFNVCNEHRSHWKPALILPSFVPALRKKKKNKGQIEGRLSALLSVPKTWEEGEEPSV